MATGGPLDDHNVAKESLTERDIELMATSLRDTGKFHVVPLYEQLHEFSYDEEQEETNISSSLRASHTPRSYEDHSKVYRPVRPHTPMPTRSPWVHLFTIIPLSPGCTCGGLFNKPYVQGFSLPWVHPFAMLSYHLNGILPLDHFRGYSLLRISYAETSFLKSGRGACKVLYKLIFNLHKVVFCAMELLETCFCVVNAILN